MILLQALMGLPMAVVIIGATVFMIVHFCSWIYKLITPKKYYKNTNTCFISIIIYILILVIFFYKLFTFEGPCIN